MDTSMEIDARLRQIIGQFQLAGRMTQCISYGNGHINDTYCLSYIEEGAVRRYILQKINRAVFPSPRLVMENMAGVTAWLRERIRENGGDAKRETLQMVPTVSGSVYYEDAKGDCWRICPFIENTVCYEKAETDEIFYQSAFAFGNFQRMMAGYPMEKLHETIADFHNTPDRLEKLEKALAADVCKRARLTEPETRFIRGRRALAGVLTDLQKRGELPLRVAHNDTKLSNVLLDRDTGKAVCVIDLDTVMPGLSVLDFGDGIRFGASTAAEDERDLSKVSCDLHLFEVYVRGFIDGCRGALNERELDMLPMGALVITFEEGIRFLTDYLEGDTYHRIHREGQNLDRCRTQLKLVQDMEEKLPQMKAIVDRYR